MIHKERKDHQAHLRYLRTRYGSVLQIRASLENELVRREQVHGPDSIEAEAAVDFLIDYEELNAQAIDAAIARDPARPVAIMPTEDDFAI